MLRLDFNENTVGAILLVANALHADQCRSVAPSTLVVVDELYEAFTGDSMLPTVDFVAMPQSAAAWSDQSFVDAYLAEVRHHCDGGNDLLIDASCWVSIGTTSQMQRFMKALLLIDQAQVSNGLDRAELAALLHQLREHHKVQC